MRHLPGLVLPACVLAWSPGCGDDGPATVDGGAGGDGGAPDALIYDARTECPPEPPPVCDFFLSCGCNTPGEKCSVRDTATGAVPMCVTAGYSVAGDPCVADDDCMGGTYCAMRAGESVCMRFCDEAHACVTSPPTACYISIVAGDPPVEIGRLCGQVCSLLGQDCAFEAQGCFPAAAYVSLPEKGICVTAGIGTQGRSCQTANECSEGFTCVDPGDGKPICAKLCNRDGSAPTCDSPLACKILAGHTQTGVCTP